ncbi:hypothetical protein ACWEPB_34240, partial [Kitasatospora cineracea]
AADGRSGQGAHAAPAAPAAVLGGPRPSAAEPSSTPGGLPRRRTATAAAAEQAAAGGTGRHRRPGEEDGGRPALPAGPAAAPAGPAAGPALTPVAGGLLPKRVRQANLAPQLRAGAGTEAAEPARERDPEEARSAFASFQRGFARGRGDRLQPASLTVVRSEPEPAGSPGTPERPAPVRAPAPGQPPRLRVALPSAPVPHALPPARSVPPAHPTPTAPPAPAEGTES